MESGEESLKLYGVIGSPFVIKVELALKLKGINNYEYFEEKLQQRKPSLELLQYNPIYKKVPVLVHNGTPILESSIIVEYIDENWKHCRPALLPHDNPKERAKARFWAKFADEKCIVPLNKILYAAAKGLKIEKAADELRANLKVLESGLEGRRFFGGEEIGFADISIGWIGMWMRVIGEVVDHKLMDDKALPLLSAYFTMFLSVPIIKDCLPSQHKLLRLYEDYYRATVAARNYSSRKPRL